MEIAEAKKRRRGKTKGEDEEETMRMDIVEI